MKTIFKIIGALSVAICCYACKKSNETIYTKSGAVDITVAVVNGAGTLNFNNTGQYVYGFSNAVFPVLAGQSPMNVYIPAVTATATTAAVPQITYYDQPLIVADKGNYSLFLSGASPAQIDNVLIKESYTETYPDSVCGVRFINLSPDSAPVSVDIQGGANGSEVSSLAYKAYSNFKQYPSVAANVNNGYTFEVRDVASGNVITTYTLTPIPKKNVTLALTGLEASSSILQINN